MIILICRNINAFIALILLTLPCSQSHAAQPPINKSIDVLESSFRSLSDAFYSDSSSYTEKSSQKHKNLEVLEKSINSLVLAKKPISAIQLIYSNLQTINDNIDTKAVQNIIELLLDQNDWKLANKLFLEIESEGDDSLLAPVKFSFAKYYAHRQQWKQVIELLDGTFSQLSDDNADYAYLLNGAALQHLKKHRLAVQSFEKISKQSQYYDYAQLNTAVANIRQGWWTDAQRRIGDLIKQSKKTNKDEITNRLYLILGYALLQREFYRDARNAFRHIGLNSRYTNRALLGIGLTATSQGDYIGGLNALTILKDKKTFDLSVDESYLLVPYVYEKLQQELTVNTSYTEAMNYYQRRINKLDKISAKHNDFASISYNAETMIILLQKNNLDYGSKYPASFISNFKQLHKYLEISKSEKIKRKLTSLIKKYDVTFQKIINDLAAQRKEYLRSYLNQSRYGLARLYDNSKESNN